jgi:hypothetical protein
MIQIPVKDFSSRIRELLQANLFKKTSLPPSSLRGEIETTKKIPEWRGLKIFPSRIRELLQGYFLRENLPSLHPLQDEIQTTKEMPERRGGQ